ncbi:MAG: hypothetical protein K2N82_04665 [Lachnospiraceae bacterium]|nr:hypothetical protein [Lachnospiraceae bacterium]
MKKRFSNLCILAVGMLAFLMYGKEKESTIQDVNAEFHVAKEDDKYENQRSIEWSIELSEILSEELLNALDNEKNCISSDKASKVAWEESISSHGETYKVSFERISALYDAKSESYRYCADYQLIVRDSDGKDISKQIITNFPVWYEEAHWIVDVSGDGFSDVVLCPFYEGYTRYTDLRFYIWNMDKSEYEEQPLSWDLWRPVWNERLSCVIFIDKSYDDIRMKMVSFENGEWVLRGELLPGETIEKTEEKVQIQRKEIFYTEEGNIENIIIVNVPEQNMPWNDVNSVWCDDNSQNEYLNLGSLDWNIIDVEFEEGKSSPKYVRQKECNVEETNADNEIDFYGVWRIDKAVLQSDMYTGTTEDGDFEENLYDPTDYIGMEIEYTPEYFRLGSERYNNPEYILINRTVKDINDGGKFYDPDIYEFIMDEEIEIFDAEKYDYLAEVPLFQVEVEFDKEVSYGEFDFIPVGTQCVILNERAMLIGLWGKILLAHRIS